MKRDLKRIGGAIKDRKGRIVRLRILRTGNTDGLEKIAEKKNWIVWNLYK